MTVVKTCDSFDCTIYIAGDYDRAREITRAYCDMLGDCYAVERTAYVYSKGEEDGVRVTRINYARFPLDAEEIVHRVVALAEQLRRGLGQESYSIVTPDETHYVSRRKEANATTPR